MSKRERNRPIRFFLPENQGKKYCDPSLGQEKGLFTKTQLFTSANAAQRKYSCKYLSVSFTKVFWCLKLQIDPNAIYKSI